MFRRLAVPALCVLLAAWALPLAFQWQQVSAAPRAVLRVPHFPRDAVSASLSKLMATTTHLLLVGPTGVGKTIAATAAASVSTPVATPGGDVCLLPFYLDLYAIAASAAATGAAADVHTHALGRFAEEARRYDLPLLRKLHDSARLGFWTYAEITLLSVWHAIATVPLKALSLLPREHEASLHGVLTHVAAAAGTLMQWTTCAGGAGRVLPVLILDEVHVLDQAGMEAVRADLLRFLSPQLQSKAAADVVVVLLSSDARAHDILHSCACTHPR
jgi:hypothetical protein